MKKLTDHQLKKYNYRSIIMKLGVGVILISIASSIFLFRNFQAKKIRTSDNNLNQLQKKLTINCYYTKVPSSVDSLLLTKNIQNSELGYLINQLNIRKITQTLDSCNSEYSKIILTQLFFAGLDEKMVKKINKTFLDNGLKNLKVKVWNRIFLDIDNNIATLTILEDRKYLNSWKNILIFKETE